MLFETPSGGENEGRGGSMGTECNYSCVSNLNVVKLGSAPSFMEAQKMGSRELGLLLHMSKRIKVQWPYDPEGVFFVSSSSHSNMEPHFMPSEIICSSITGGYHASSKITFVFNLDSTRGGGKKGALLKKNRRQF